MLSESALLHDAVAWTNDDSFEIGDKEAVARHIDQLGGPYPKCKRKGMNGRRLCVEATAGARLPQWKTAMEEENA